MSKRTMKKPVKLPLATLSTSVLAALPLIAAMAGSIGGGGTRRRRR
jgi:hypothetical protein